MVRRGCRFQGCVLRDERTEDRNNEIRLIWTKIEAAFDKRCRKLRQLLKQEF